MDMWKRINKFVQILLQNEGQWIIDLKLKKGVEINKNGLGTGDLINLWP